MNWISVSKDSGKSILGRGNSTNKHSKVEISRVNIHVTVRSEFTSWFFFLIAIDFGSSV